MDDDKLIEMIKDMYSIEGIKLKRINDCSDRDFVTHEDCGDVFCAMKIKTLRTVEIAYILHFNKIPNGRVCYVDGNRLNINKENLKVVPLKEYLTAVNLALQIISDTKDSSDVRNEFDNPKDLLKYITLKGIESIGYQESLSLVKCSSLGDRQKWRATNMINEILLND